jgi:hypothetical protein
MLYGLCTDCVVKLTNTMEQSTSWQANKPSARQEISHILLKLKVHYRIHKSPPLLPILNQINPVHASILFLILILILSFHLRLRLSTAHFPSGFATKPWMYLSLPHKCHKPRSHILLGLIIRITFGEEYRHKAARYAISVYHFDRAKTVTQ